MHDSLPNHSKTLDPATGVPILSIQGPLTHLNARALLHHVHALPEWQTSPHFLWDFTPLKPHRIDARDVRRFVRYHFRQDPQKKPHPKQGPAFLACTASRPFDFGLLRLMEAEMDNASRMAGLSLSSNARVFYSNREALDWFCSCSPLIRLLSHAYQEIQLKGGQPLPFLIDRSSRIITLTLKPEIPYAFLAQAILDLEHHAHWHPFSSFLLDLTPLATLQQHLVPTLLEHIASLSLVPRLTAVTLPQRFYHWTMACPLLYKSLTRSTRRLFLSVEDAYAWLLSPARSCFAFPSFYLTVDQETSTATCTFTSLPSLKEILAILAYLRDSPLWGAYTKWVWDLSYMPTHSIPQNTAVQLSRAFSPHPLDIPRYMAIVAPQHWLYALSNLFVHLTRKTNHARRVFLTRSKARAWLRQFSPSLSLSPSYEQKSPLR